MHVRSACTCIHAAPARRKGAAAPCSIHTSGADGRLCQRPSVGLAACCGLHTESSRRPLSHGLFNVPHRRPHAHSLQRRFRAACA